MNKRFGLSIILDSDDMSMPYYRLQNDERYLQANEGLEHLHWSKKFCGTLIIPKIVHNL
jgi:hypothetical protein